MRKGDGTQYLEAIYKYFADDFLLNRPRFKGKPVVLGSNQLVAGKEQTFWHVISEGAIEEKRAPNLRRCERIRWPKAIIGHAGDPSIKIWENERKGWIRTLLWLETSDYLVVLTVKPTYYQLWTAYLLYGEQNRQALRKEYEAWTKAEAARHE